MTKEEAIKRIKDWNLDDDDMEVLSTLIPELKDSEDERIRKYIMDIVKGHCNGSVEYKKCIAWLKKQGELSKYNPHKETVESISTMVDKYSRADSDLQDFYDNVKVKCKDAIEYYNTFIEKQDEQKKKHQKSTNNIIEEEKSLLEKFKQTVYDCAWEKVTCKKEGETKEEYAERWAEHFLLMVRDWADDYIDFTIQQKLRNNFEKGKTKTDIIEKQDEQKSIDIDKVEPKFKVGDWVIDKQDIVHQIANVVENMTNHTYGYDTVNGEYFNDNTEGVRLWTIEDAKDGDVLAIDWKDEWHWQKIVIFKSLNEFGVEGYGNTFANNKLAFKEDVPYYSKTWTKYLYPATHEQRDLLFTKMKEAGYEWDAEKKELKKIEPKPAWSEEDERIFVSIMEDVMPCGECPDYPTDEERKYFYEGNRKVDWLKSLKERVQLQPQPKQELSEDTATNEYIELGLPSGTLWKLVNEKGYYTFDEAIVKFGGGNIPNKEQWEELKEKCKWVWKEIGYEVTGPNGNTIYLPANGYGYGNGTGLLNVGTYGYYWSSTHHNEAGAYYMGFSDPVSCMNNGPRFCGLSVRLVK